MENTNIENSFLSGEHIYLRTVEKEDLNYIKRWYNDKEIRMLSGIDVPTTEQYMEEFYDKVQDTSDRIWFMVVEKENNNVIGEVGLLRMYHSWRTTDLTIIIGEKAYRGKGYGKEAILLLMDYAFGHLNFHRISIGVVGFNDNALKFYEKIGFKQEGIQRDGYYYDYKYHDFIMMSILEDEFIKLYKDKSN